MDETLIERDFALMNELKAETDALLSDTRVGEHMTYDCLI